VSETLATVAVTASREGIELNCSVPDDVRDGLIGDPTRLRQVLLNLLSNSIKFTHEGEVSLTVELVEDLSDLARLHFEIKDTGIGIPADRMDRLFQSFTQVDASDTRRYGGTGLGLTITKDIVEAMGGSIFVTSEVGKGSTFWFDLDLPVNQSFEAPQAELAPAGLPILIAERSQMSRDSIASWLGANRVVEVESAAEAAEALGRHAQMGQPFELMLLDSRMLDDLVPSPGESSVQLPPTILLTGVDRLAKEPTPPAFDRLIRLSRPISRRNLIWCIHELFDTHVSPSEEETKPPDEMEVASRIGARRVLVAEDNPVNQKIATRFLDKLGMKWEVANDGVEAVEAFQRSDFDLVLLDLQMPHMDGLEAARRIATLSDGLRVRPPLIALTASVLEEHREQSNEAGFDDYLTKPIKIRTLRDCVLRWLEEPAPALGTPEQHRSPELSRLLGHTSAPELLRLKDESGKPLPG